MILEIKLPIWVKDNMAYVSISDYTFKKMADKEGNLKVKVYQGSIFKGKGIINQKNWIKTAKDKQERVFYRPDEPIKFYYNIISFIKPQTEEEKMIEFCKQNY